MKSRLLSAAILLAPAAVAAQQNYPANIARQVARVHAESASSHRFKPNWN